MHLLVREEAATEGLSQAEQLDLPLFVGRTCRLGRPVPRKLFSAFSDHQCPEMCFGMGLAQQQLKDISFLLPQRFALRRPVAFLQHGFVSLWAMQFQKSARHVMSQTHKPVPTQRTTVRFQQKKTRQQQDASSVPRQPDILQNLQSRRAVGPYRSELRVGFLLHSRKKASWSTY